MLCCVSCSTPGKPAARDLLEHKIRRLSYWMEKFNPMQRIEDRVGPATADVIEFVTMDNKFHGFPERPAEAVLNDGFKKDFREALAGLPEQVKALAGPTVFGIFYLKNLGTTGFAESVFDDKGNPAGAFLVFDAGYLHRKANDWASLRENTPFADFTSGVGAAEVDARVVLEIEDDKDNNRLSAIQFIALHELGHAIAFTGNVHPSYAKPLTGENHPSRFPFSRLSWSTDKNGNLVSVYDKLVFPERTSVVFYAPAGKKLPVQHVARIYNHLSRTSFFTLYGSVSPYDDFAEAFAVYVHVKLLGRPYRVFLQDRRKRFKLFAPCWESGRCGAKMELLKKLLK